VGSQVPSYNHFILVVLLYWLSLSSTSLGVDSLQAMSFWSHTWLRVSISIYCPREYRLWSHRWSILFGSSYPDGGLSSLTMGYDKVLFHYEHPLELMDEEDRVMKRDTSRVMKHNPILQGDMSSTYGRKCCMRGQEIFLLLTISILFFPQSRHPLSFLVLPPPFINLGMRFILRGETYNTPCYGFTNYLLTTFISSLATQHDRRMSPNLTRGTG
jgi:hypothetical protein